MRSALNRSRTTNVTYNEALAITKRPTWVIHAEPPAVESDRLREQFHQSHWRICSFAFARRLSRQCHEAHLYMTGCLISCKPISCLILGRSLNVFSTSSCTREAQFVSQSISCNSLYHLSHVPLWHGCVVLRLKIIHCLPVSPLCSSTKTSILAFLFSKSCV